MAKVCLLLAPCESATYDNFLANLPPLSLGVLTAYLRERGVQVCQYDLNIESAKRLGHFKRERLEFFYRKAEVLAYLRGSENTNIDEVLAALLGGIDLASFDLVGISCGADFSWMQIHSAFLIGSYIQRRYGKPVAFGGNNVTFLYQFKDILAELWECILSSFRWLIVGPGEIPLYQLIQSPQDTTALTALPGLVHMEAGRVVAHAQNEPTIQQPDWDGLELDTYESLVRAPGSEADEAANQTEIFKWDSFLVNVLKKKRSQQRRFVGKLIIPYVFNYNCPYRCAFCGESAEEKRRVVLGEVNAVLDDIEQLMTKYQSNYFYFFNNAINYSKRFVREFCQGIAQRGLEFYWSDCARFNNMDRSLLQMLKEAGCRKLTFGLETASPTIIQLIDKRVNLEQAQQVLTWCTEVGIWADLEIIVGLPYEHETEFTETYDFLVANDKYLNHVHINEYFIVPDSLLGRYPERYGIEILRDVLNYDDLLRINQKWFTAGASPLQRPRNFNIYRYNELNGRNFPQVELESHAHADRLAQFQYRKYAAIWKQFA